MISVPRVGVSAPRLLVDTARAVREDEMQLTRMREVWERTEPFYLLGTGKVTPYKLQYMCHMFDVVGAPRQIGVNTPFFRHATLF